MLLSRQRVSRVAPRLQAATTMVTPSVSTKAL